MSDRPRVWPPLLDWSGPGHWGVDEPCVLCGSPTPLRSDSGKPCHKVCAEEWFEKRPEAWAQLIQRQLSARPNPTEEL